MEANDVIIVSVRKAGGEWSFIGRTREGIAPMNPGEWHGPFDSSELRTELTRLGLSESTIEEKIVHARAYLTTVTERSASQRELDQLRRMTGR